MGEHELKTWPEPFQQVWLGNKTHEIRKADRLFAVGDVLHLREWKPRGGVDRMFSPGDIAADHPGEYTGRFIRAEITYLSMGGTWGLPDGLCVMSIRPINKGEEP